ncbi:MAG TPA: DUF4386 family protein [Kofleriaceae bacterium]|jgi:hypothetical protein|nr:DUF4386 family protein [Kofleriaceae bacterium]
MDDPVPHAVSHPTISWRAGATCVGAAGVLIPAATLLRGPFVDPHADPAAFAAWVTSKTYMPAGILFIVGLFFQMFGVLGLYQLLARGRSPRLAVTGTILTFVTDALMLVAMGVFCFTLSEIGHLYRQGHSDVLAMATSFSSSFIAFQVVQALTLTVGTVLTAIAISRSPELPRWSAPAYAVSGLVIALSPPLPFLAELPATAIYGITYVALARCVWRASGTGARSTQPV